MSRLTVFAALILLVLVQAFPAAAQDSFARYRDERTGEKVLGGLGTGLGQRYATLALEVPCPGNLAWVVEVTGLHAPEEWPVAMGFRDLQGGWTPVPVQVLRYDDGRVTIGVDRAAFRDALATARRRDPVGRKAELRIILGDVVGLAVDREAMAREMADFARDCGPLRGSAPRFAALR